MNSAPRRGTLDPATRPLPAPKAPLALRIEAIWQKPDWRWHWLLRPIESIYAALTASRRWLYRLGLFKSRSLPVPVVVVGNRVAGGAGKTPTTMALVTGLQARGWHPGIVSRGFGGQARQIQAVTEQDKASVVGDEPLLMARRTGVPVWVGRQRHAAGAALCQAEPGVDILICDDGLQHLQLARDVDIIVFDERGAGNGHLLPAGPLREPIDAPSLARRQWVIYNATGPSTKLAGLCTQRKLLGLVGLADWWRGQPASLTAVHALRGQQGLTASAGIGQPQRFFDALGALGLHVQPWPLDDHASLDPLPWPASVRYLIVTEKDAIKLAPERLQHERPDLQVWVAPLAFALPAAMLDELSAELTAGRSAQRSGMPKGSAPDPKT